MRLVVTGGGTGGHIYPALAIAERVLAEFPNSEVLYIGSEQGLEKDIVEKTDLPFAAVKSKGLPRKLNKDLVQAVFESSQGVFMANKILKDFRPDVVLGTGGFVCGPTLLAAKKLGIKTLIHEQNAYPGVTNKLLAPLVDRTLLSFPQAKDYFKGPVRSVVTGLPVREKVGSASKEDACRFLGLDPKRPVILVTGGSRGARSINRVIAMSAERILKNFDVQIVFVTGKEGYTETTLLLREFGIQASECDDLFVRDYIYDMPMALAAADLVIGRAGATFLAEIAICGLPGILVPYPYASENHQAFNAAAFVEAGGALSVADKDLTVPKLMELLAPFLENKAYRDSMSDKMRQLAKPRALDDIVKIMQDLLESEGKSSRIKQKRKKHR